MSEKYKIWKRTVFWENIKKTIAVFSAPGIFLEHKLDAHEGFMWGTLTFSVLGAILAIWCVDNNKNGIVDLFE